MKQLADEGTHPLPAAFGGIEARLTATEHDEFICFVGNSTERKQIEQALRTSEERYRMVVSSAPIILFATDTAGVITFSERRGLQGLGVTPGQLIGCSAFDVYRDIPEILDALHRTPAGERLSKIIQLGDQIAEVHYTPQYGTEGQVSGLIGVATDITERVQAEEALRHQALYDSLTELPNRTFL